MGVELSFLEHCKREGDACLDQIVTGDVTWVQYVNAETKLQSMQWGHTASPKKPTKCHQTLSKRKLMATVFWDRRELLLVEFLERNVTTNAEHYCNKITNLRRAIQNKHHGMLSNAVDQVVACMPGLDPRSGQVSWVRFFRGFSSPVRQMSGSFRPPKVPE